MSSKLDGRESGDRPKADLLDEEAQQFQSGALLSPQLRAAVRLDLTPSAEDAERVRHRLWSAISTGVLPPAVHRVDIAMASHAAGIKAGGVTAVGHTLATKLIVSSLMLAGAVGVATVAAPHKATENQSHAVVAKARVTRSVAPKLASNALPSSGATLGPVLPVVPTPSPPPAAGPIDAPSAVAPQVSLPNQWPVMTHTVEPAVQQGVRPAQLVLRGGRSIEVASLLPLTAAALKAFPIIPVPKAAAAPRATPAQPNPALSAELLLVHAASAALDRHDPQRALVIVSQYRTQYPEGGLRAEVEALRVMALCLAHRSDAAAERDTFLHDHPASALAARVVRACVLSH